MDDLDLDLEKDEREQSDTIGALDRLILGAGLVVVAVIPTLFYIVAMPWRAAPLLAGETPKGRSGVILGPGIFFVAGMLLLMIVTSAVDNFAPEASSLADEVASADLADLDMPTEEEGGGGRSSRVLGALAEGNIWEAAAQIAPIFVVACMFGAVSAGVGRFASRRWTVRAAVGGMLYQVTVLLLSAALFIGIPGELGAADGPGSIVVIIGILTWLFVLFCVSPWQYFWFLHGYTGARKHVCGLVTVGIIVAIVLTFFGIGLFAALTDQG